MMKHKAIRIDNLMYNGCEPHWKCTKCKECVPFRCYTKEQFEQMDCKKKTKPQTNFDKITASEEALVEFIQSCFTEYCAEPPYCMFEYSANCEQRKNLKNCKKGIADWLRATAE